MPLSAFPQTASLDPRCSLFSYDCGGDCWCALSFSPIASVGRSRQSCHLYERCVLAEIAVEGSTNSIPRITREKRGDRKRFRRGRGRFEARSARTRRPRAPVSSTATYRQQVHHDEREAAKSIVSYHIGSGGRKGRFHQQAYSCAGFRFHISTVRRFGFEICKAKAASYPQRRFRNSRFQLGTYTCAEVENFMKPARQAETCTLPQKAAPKTCLISAMCFC